MRAQSVTVKSLTVGILCAYSAEGRPLVETFGEALKRLRTERRLSLRGLQALTRYSAGYLGELERGAKRPTASVAQHCDRALEARGQLTSLASAFVSRSVHQVNLGGDDGVQEPPAEQPHGRKDHDVQRRTILRDLSTLALASSLATAETIRQNLEVAATNVDPVEQWDRIVDEYARTFYTDDPTDLLRDITADMTVLSAQLKDAMSRTRRRALSRASGQLAAITAMAWASLGEFRQAGRWWSTAQATADASTDRAAQVWVRGWRVADGLYEQRGPDEIFIWAHEAVAIADGRPSAGLAGTLAGLAQTQAVADHPDALNTLIAVREITERVTDIEAADTASMFGWPSVRLHHTASYVYTALGMTAEAYAAQDAALALYGSDLVRERAAMQLHRAQCMIRDGDVSGGIRYAEAVLDDLASEHHTELVYTVARSVLTAVPDRDAKLKTVTGLAARLALPVGRA
jgi:transcriptional regulator with XRE-family HTH domain